MIEARGVELRFGTQRALAGVDLTVPDRGLVALTGHSGSGKSSLLHVLSGLRRPSAGAVLLDGTPLASQPTTHLRSRVVAFVFQDHFLVPYLTAMENVLAGVARPGLDDRARAGALIRELDLAAVAGRRASQLSGGERQRVAVARGLVRAPRYLFADEPTAALDRASAHRVFSLIRHAARDHAVLLVTHDAEALALAERVVELRDGRIVADQAGLAAAASG